LDSICYVYGVVPSSLNIQKSPKGLDSLPVQFVVAGEVAALVTHLPAADYSPEKLELRAGDVDWLGPRALAHDAVVTWASDTAQIAPFPMWTLFRNDESVRAMLEERAKEFGDALRSVSGASEYAVRVFASPAQVLELIGELRPAIAELQSAAAKASPGQRYLLQKKITEQREQEVRAYLRETAQDCFDKLREKSVKAVRHKLPAETPAGKGRAILYAAFLVKTETLDDFRKVLTDLISQHKRSGLDFDFTGPWPPYNFVGTRDG
jgi:hypothetical protein